MNLFDWLLVGHVVGDWLLQSSAQAAAKEYSARARLEHVAVWWLAVTVFAALWWAQVRPAGAAGLGLVAAACALLAVIHFLQDSRRPVVWFCRVVKRMGPEAVEGWLTIVVDQCLHLLQLAAAAAVLAAMLTPRG